MLHALDTNTCIDLLRGRSDRIAQRLYELSPAQVALPSLVYAELLLGAALSADPSRNRRLIERLVAPLRILDFDASAAVAYASIRAELQTGGVCIGPNDLVIAATALAHQALLITANFREFRRVPGLRVEDWRPQAKGSCKVQRSGTSRTCRKLPEGFSSDPRRCRNQPLSWYRWSPLELYPNRWGEAERAKDATLRSVLHLGIICREATDDLKRRTLGIVEQGSGDA